ncbi:hypothetical protein [Anaerocolumna jejuensis]|uniref:hypothetical protein n=1 Tax=Anaerocolumna jejuensis TaxID=259063 RepID=UPI003F7BCC70
MNGYEKILSIIQKTGESSPALFITIMDTASTCRVNELPLDADDILIADHLKTGWYKQEGNSMIYVSPLKAGDSVLVVKVNDEKYAILERLVIP